MPDPFVTKRMQDIVRMAWAEGNKAIQSGSWPYFDAELDKLEEQEPGIKQKALDMLKDLRKSNV